MVTPWRGWQVAADVAVPFLTGKFGNCEETAVAFVAVASATKRSAHRARQDHSMFACSSQ